MHFIIFGAGEVGKRAWEFLQNDRVKCFADNYKAGHKVHTIMGNSLVEKEVIGFLDMMKIYSKGQTIVVVASGNYSENIVSQLEQAGVYRYFVFRESDAWKIWLKLPTYRLYRRYESVTYTKRLADHNITNYKKIVILGSNEFIPYLISAIAFQAGFESIFGIVDTPDVDGINVMGIPIISWEKTVSISDCVVVNSPLDGTYYFDELEEKKQKFHILNLYEVEKDMPVFYHPELGVYKDRHKGKRCFVLGNGPSLNVDDLEKLKENNEICFGVNKVYRIYPKTSWRANYISVTDCRIIEDMRNDSLDSIPGVKFISDQIHKDSESLLDGFNIVHLFEETYYPRNFPRFSSDITKGVYLGCTVVYDMSIQIAAYMGFDEIYLLGVDLSYSNNNVSDNHFIKDYTKNDEVKKYVGVNYDEWTPKVIRAFEKAERYSRQHGFRIYNATRGGNLEIFERVDFDKLFT